MIEIINLTHNPGLYDDMKFRDSPQISYSLICSTGGQSATMHRPEYSSMWFRVESSTEFYHH